MSSFLMFQLLKKLMTNLMEDLLMEDPSDLIVLLKERDQLEVRVDLEVKADSVVEDSKTTEVLEIKETQEWT